MTDVTGGMGGRAENLQAGKAKRTGLGGGLGSVPLGLAVGELLAGREYLRVSEDRSGAARSPEEQHGENVAEAARVGITLGVPYRDDNRSASRFKHKEREQFDQLIADLENDAFGARVLMLWESSRGSREVGEWVHLIELCERRAVLIHVTTHHRTYDPSNGRDRRSLIEDATDSEYESWKISQRSSRATSANAAAGKPHGRVPFGYRRVYDPFTRRFVAQEPEPAEAKIVGELFKRLEARHSLREITAYFARKGYVDRKGNEFSAETLRTMALNRAYIGERVFEPGRRGGRASKNAQHMPAQWDALVSRDRFFSVQDILVDSKRKKSRPGRGVHFVSMIGRCYRCGGVIAFREVDKAPLYTCHKRGCVKIPKPDVDLVTERAVKAFVKRSDVYEQFAQRAGNPDDLRQIRDEVAEIEREYRELGEAVGRGEISSLLAARAEPGIVARLQAAQAEEKALTTPAELSGLFDEGQDVDRWWEDAPMSTRRTVARFLLRPEWLGYLVILPATMDGHRVEPGERIEFRTEWDPDTIPAPPKRRPGLTASQKAAAAKKASQEATDRP